MKKRKEKSRFYNDKNRNTKWTQPPTGRPIDFADKYDAGSGYNIKYQTTQRSRDEIKRKQEAKSKRKKRILAFVMSILLICTGYIATDIYMIRHAVPAEQIAHNNDSESGNMADITLDLVSRWVESVSLDNSVMLESVIKDTQEMGYNSITFDAKRSDGTIGYASALASIDTYGAISNNSTKTKESVSKLLANDILPIARISCYRDNVVPAQNDSMALKNGGSYYTDRNNNTYLNPDSEATYEYIKDIVQELYYCGITVFLFNNCTLPGDVSKNYHDGYKIIAEKLQNDFDNKIKIMQEVRITIRGVDDDDRITNSAIDKEIKDFKKIKPYQMYYIATQLDDERIMDHLMQNNVKNFILEQ